MSCPTGKADAIAAMVRDAMWQKQPPGTPQAEPAKSHPPAGPPPLRPGVVRYHDGVAWVHGDAGRLHRRLVAALNDEVRAATAIIRDPAQPPGKRAEAEQQLLDAARWAFEFAPVDPATGGGVVDDVVARALAALFARLAPDVGEAGGA